MAVIGGHFGSAPSPAASPNERASTAASTLQFRKNATECRSVPGVFGARTLCGADLVPPVRPAQEHVPDVGEYRARHGVGGDPNRSGGFVSLGRADFQAADVVLDEEGERTPVRVRAASRAVADVRIDRALLLLLGRVSKQTELGERVVDVFFEPVRREAERDGEAPHERRRDDAAVGVVSRDRLLEPVETDRPLGVQSPAVARHVARNVGFFLIPAALAVDAFSELEHLTESSLVQLLRPGRFVPRALAASRPERHLRRVRQREETLRGSQRSVDRVIADAVAGDVEEARAPGRQVERRRRGSLGVGGDGGSEPCAAHQRGDVHAGDGVLVGSHRAPLACPFDCTLFGARPGAVWRCVNCPTGIWAKTSENACDAVRICTFFRSVARNETHFSV